jgi:hypothetical protein
VTVRRRRRMMELQTHRRRAATTTTAHHGATDCSSPRSATTDGVVGQVADATQRLLPCLLGDGILRIQNVLAIAGAVWLRQINS